MFSKGSEGINGYLYLKSLEMGGHHTHMYTHKHRYRKESDFGSTEHSQD